MLSWHCHSDRAVASSETIAIGGFVFHPDLIRHPDGCPALVLNADYTPLSYYPLSVWPWQTAVKAVFLERVDIVAHYEREVRSASCAMKLPSVIALKQYVRPSQFPAFTRFNLFLRDRFGCQYCGAQRDLTFDHVCPRGSRRAHDVGERRHRLCTLQPEKGRTNAPSGVDAAPRCTDPPDELATSGTWPQLPAQLSPRHLA